MESTKRTIYNKNYQNKDRERTRYLNSRSAARGFIKNKATQDDLKELKDIISLKIKQHDDSVYKKYLVSNDGIQVEFDKIEGLKSTDKTNAYVIKNGDMVAFFSLIGKELKYSHSYYSDVSNLKIIFFELKRI